MEEKYWLFYLLALIAEIIGTTSGFGSSILFVPLAAMFFDFHEVLGITALFHVFSNLSKIFLFRKGINKKIALKLGIPAVIFVAIGAFLSKYIPQKELEVAMNIILVILAVYLIRNFNKTLPQSDRNLVTGGVFSGFLAGLVGTGGAIRGISLAAFHLPKDIFIATSALIDMGVDTTRAAVYFFNGYMSKDFIILIPFLILISILGSWIGKQILKFTSEKIFRYLVLGVILLTSVVQLVKYFTGDSFGFGS